MCRAVSSVGISTYHVEVMGLTPGCNILPLEVITHTPHVKVASSSHKHIMLPQSGLELTTTHTWTIAHTMTALRTLASYATSMYLLCTTMMRRESCASLTPGVTLDTRCQYLLPWYPYLLLILDTFDLNPRSDLEQRAPVSLLTISNSLAT